MTPFALDASVALSWFMPDESEPYAEDVLRSLTAVSAITVGHFGMEVCNGLLVGERRNRISPQEVQHSLSRLRVLPLAIRITEADRFDPILALARSHELSFYDAAYVDLCLSEGTAFASLDAKLNRAVLAAGGSLYQP